jgi:hypothetical protein
MEVIMAKKSETINKKNHDIGKKGEHETWPLLEKAGFIRVNNMQRLKIKEYYAKKGIEIEQKGFDAVRVEDIDFIGKKSVILYEVKTTEKIRGKNINENFSGFGFTLTEKEKYNSDILKNKYQFIFVNLNKKIFKIYKISDFFNNNFANIYQTWSVFIVKDLK